MHRRRLIALNVCLVLFILSEIAHPVISDESQLWRRLSHRQRWIVSKRAPSSGAKKVCGKQLRSLFSMVCQNRYQSKHSASIEMARRASPPIMKRDPEYATDVHFQQYEEDPSDPESIFLDSQTASIFLHRRSEAAGAYSECCLKACTISEIVGYCHPDVQKTKWGIANPKE